MNTSKLLTPAEVAEQLSTSVNFVKAELRRKHMRGILMPAGWRIEHAAVLQYIEDHANVAPVRRRSA